MNLFYSRLSYILYIFLTLINICTSYEIDNNDTNNNDDDRFLYKIGAMTGIMLLLIFSALLLCITGITDENTPMLTFKKSDL